MSELEAYSDLFVRLVLEKANLALMFLGRMPRPDGKQLAIDLDAARFCIDTLEMLEAKTKGNLSEQESRLLSDILTELRLAYVETSQRLSNSTNTPSGSDTGQQLHQNQPKASEEQNRRRFFKSYGS